MSNLHCLPVELLFHLFKFLDTDTILLSFRFVCQRFYLVSNAYNQYRLSLQSCTKWNFSRFCRIINPVNIVSLVLSDDDQTPGQISLFLTFFNFKQFENLRSLTIIDIENINLNAISRDLSALKLHSLAIQSRALCAWTNQTLACLSTLLEQSSLKQFTLSIWCFEIYDFSWPYQCPIESLHISNRITYEQYCSILDRCFKLKKLIIKDVLWNDTSVVSTNQYRQLQFLALEDNRMDIYKLEQFLSLTPSLTYLKVMGMAYLIDSYRWEKILRIKLPNLERFEFFFISWKNVNYSFSDIQSLIRPFQTSFWLENKKWLVNCDYILHPTEVILYSLPICKSYFQYHDPANKISCANVSKISLDATMMEQVTDLKLNLLRSTFDRKNLQKIELSPYPLFPHVTNLTVDLDDKCPSNLSFLLSNLITLAHLTELKINLNYDLVSDASTTENLLQLFQQTSHMQTLEIQNNLSLFSSHTTIEDICHLVPLYIKHLKMTVKNINDMKMIFDRFSSLSSLTFYFPCQKSIPSKKLIESFLNIQKDLTYRKDDSVIRVWLNPK